ncbi:MAG: hypothetical protein KDK65_05800 [Chlamydiia bacterium]|nr:hypothetical protein [Chlamydiia bacterium]
MLRKIATFVLLIPALYGACPNTCTSVYARPDPTKGLYDLDFCGNFFEKAKVRDKDFGGDLFRYTNWQVSTQFGNLQIAQAFLGFTTRIGYSQTYFGWSNPYYSQEHFDNIVFAIGSYSNAINQWMLNCEMKINFNTNHVYYGKYISYDFIGWARYLFSETLFFHAGGIGMTGMNINRFYPIIGLEWQPWENFKFNFVYPCDMSIAYLITDKIAIDIAYQLFYNRQRVGKHAHYSRGTLEYRSCGWELGLTFDDPCSLYANIHAGLSQSGRFEVSNKHRHNRKQLKIKDCAYYGGELAFKF